MAKASADTIYVLKWSETSICWGTREPATYGPRQTRPTSKKLCAATAAQIRNCMRDCPANPIAKAEPDLISFTRRTRSKRQGSSSMPAAIRIPRSHCMMRSSRLKIPEPSRFTSAISTRGKKVPTPFLHTAMAAFRHPCRLRHRRLPARDIRSLPPGSAPRQKA